MNYLLLACLFGGVFVLNYFLSGFLSLAIILIVGLLPILVLNKINARITEIELKMLADSLELQSSLKKQIVGAVDFYMRSEKEKNHEAASQI